MLATFFETNCNCCNHISRIMLFLRHASNAARKMAIPSAEFIVAVASGKGGVGKSTIAGTALECIHQPSTAHFIAVNLAVALAHRLGPVVGLMVCAVRM